MNVTAPSVPYWTGGAAFHQDRADGTQNFLRKGNHEPTKEAEEALRALAGVMRLDRHADLHNTPAKDNDAQRLDDAENKIRKVVYNVQRVAARCHCMRGAAKAKDGSTSRRPIALLHLISSQHRLLFQFLHVLIPPY